MKDIWIIILMIVVLVSCSEEEEILDSSFLQTKTAANNAIDLWITENYTTPFNIAVQYKWEPFEVPLNKTLVPVKEDKVIPVMTAVRQVWIGPYAREGGVDFIKKHAPRQFVLVGSAQYNSDGTFVLGEAESGRKITLFVINDFDKKNTPAVKELLHTIHHEYAHVLHQTKLYPREFKPITANGYTATWYNTDVASARALGFITPYARASADEDFVEMIATMLVEGKSGYEAILSETPATGRYLLRQKEVMVVSYFKSTWNIDFYKLQEATTQAIIDAAG